MKWNGTNGRRLGQRTPTSTRARVYDEGGRSVEVMLKDISANGARIATTEGEAIPRRFRMRFGEYEAFAEVVWRKGGDIGLRFVTPGEEEGRVRARPPTPTQKTPLQDLRAKTRLRRKALGFLFG